MRKKEQRLWDTMRRNAPPVLWLQRVENSAADGMPDVVVDAAVWVELKSVRRPKRPGTRLLGNEGLRPSQINWHMKAVSRAARSYILIRDDTGALFLIPGVWAREVNEWPANKMEINSLAYDWPGIFKEIA